MARGYYNGSDWVEYVPGPLSKNTPTSQQEYKKYSSKNISVNPVPDTNKKNCPICNKSQNILNSHCINCGYQFNVSNLDDVIVTGKTVENVSIDSSTIKADSNVSKQRKKLSKMPFNSFFNHLNKVFILTDFIKWDKESIPINHNNKLKRYFSHDISICFSIVEINDKEKLYLFSTKKDRCSKLTLVDCENPKKSNFRVLGDELLISVQKTGEIGDEFHLRKTTDNQFYLSLGNLHTDEIIQNLEILINNYEDSIINPLLKNYAFYEYLDLTSL